MHPDTIQAPERAPAAILTDMDVLREAATLLAEADRLRAATRANEIALRALCRQYDLATGARAIQPHHLRYNCEARGLLPIPRIG
ncbi:MAG: hypothetical protein ACOYBR_10345 [Fluviibacter sp.]